MKMRVLSLLLCCFVVFTLLLPFSSTAATIKKVVIVQESNDEIRDGTQKNIIAALSKAGYTTVKKNVVITQIQMKSDVKKSAEVISQIKKLKPDVVVVNSATTTNETVGKALSGSGIPVVVCVGADSLGVVDKNGKPTGNVTGINLMPKNLKQSAFNLLKQIAPLNGKKAVFVTVDGFFKKADIESGLKACGITLKAYCESKYTDDFKAAVTKYNNDPEVGWVLVGIWPSTNKNGSAGSQLDMAKWDIANRKKPSVTFWDIAVQMGILCGLGVDLNEVGTQAGEMAAKILKGENVKNVLAQDPRKVNIILNQKTATTMKIQFPASILGSASQVYKTTIIG